MVYAVCIILLTLESLFFEYFAKVEDPKGNQIPHQRPAADVQDGPISLAWMSDSARAGGPSVMEILGPHPESVPQFYRR